MSITSRDDMRKSINYLYLNVSEFLLEVVKSDPANTKEWLLKLIDSVVNERLGEDAYADKIIKEMADFRQKSAERQKAYRERMNGNGQANIPKPNEKAFSKPQNAKTKASKSDPIKDTFEFFRKMFGGRKDGLDVEYDRFTKACEKYGLKPSEEVVKLCDAWVAEDAARKEANATGAFYPLPKNLGTWLNNLCWQQEQAKTTDTPQTSNLSQAQRLMIQMDKQ
jgi:hypothetical protein